jgi:hypothetical protein
MNADPPVVPRASKSRTTGTIQREPVERECVLACERARARAAVEAFARTPWRCSSWIVSAPAWVAAVIPVSIEALPAVRAGAVALPGESLPSAVPAPDELDSAVTAVEG